MIIKLVNHKIQLYIVDRYLGVSKIDDYLAFSSLKFEQKFIRI